MLLSYSMEAIDMLKRKIHEKLGRKSYTSFIHNFFPNSYTFYDAFSFLFTFNIQFKKLLGVLSNQEYILIPRAAKRLVPKALARFLIMAQLKKDDGIL